jgi:hypothetical protein
MKPSTHACPYPGCEQRVTRNMLACKPHWFKLPRPVRDEVWRSWRALQRESTLETRREHEWALQSARGFWKMGRRFELEKLTQMSQDLGLYGEKP